MKTTNKQIEERLRNAVSYATPNVIDQVLLCCEDRKGEVIEMTRQTKTTQSKQWIYKLGAAAAAFVMVLGGGFAYAQYQGSTNVDSIVGFDVNPSIELAVNKAEKVIGVKPLNDDAVIIIGEMDFKGAKLDVAVNALIGSMLENGYISELKNSVLITVENSNNEKSLKLEEKLTKEVEKLLSDKSVNAAILAQSAQVDEKLQKLADENKISTGKAKLISEIIEQDGKQSFEKLAGLTINELNFLINSKKLNINNVATTGAANEKAYIGAEKAKAIAIANAGATDAKNVTVEIENELGKVVYEVDFQAGTMEYDYDIDAATGAILFTHKEPFIANKTEKEKAESAKEIAAEKAEKEKELAEEKLEKEKEAAKDKAEAEAEKLEKEKELAEEKLEKEKDAAKDKAEAEAEKLEKEKEAAEEKLEKEKDAAKDKAEAEAEKLEKEKEAAEEKLEKEKDAAKDKAEAEAEKLEKEKEAAEEKLEKEKEAAKDKAEAEADKAEQEKEAAEDKLEQEKEAANDKAEAEADKAEQEKEAAEDKAEAEAEKEPRLLNEEEKTQEANQPNAETSEEENNQADSEQDEQDEPEEETKPAA